MQRIKKHIPAILYAVLLFTIAVLCILITDAFPTAALPDAASTSSPDANEPSSAVLPGEDIRAGTTGPESASVKTYADSVPRTARKGDKYLYEQTIYGNGYTKLCDVTQTSVGVFVFAETNSTEGDVHAASPGVGVIKIDACGNILKTTALDPACAATYVTASPTIEGLTLVTRSADRKDYFVSVLSYDLDQISSFRISAAESGRIAPTENSFLFFAEYENETLVYSFSQGNFTFQSVGAGRLVEIFEYGTYYQLYTTDEDKSSFTVTKLDKTTLNVLSELTRVGSCLQYVFPLAENGKQIFLSLEDKGGAIWTCKYETAAFTSVVASKRIGSFSLIDAYSDGDKLLLVCEGNLTGTVTIRADLSSSPGESETPFVAAKIADSVFAFDTLYYLASDESGTLALVSSRPNIRAFDYFDFTTENARLLVNLDGTLTVVFQDNDDVRVVCVET